MRVKAYKAGPMPTAEASGQSNWRSTSTLCVVPAHRDDDCLENRVLIASSQNREVHVAMTRRQMLAAAGTATAWMQAKPQSKPAVAESAKLRNMGGAPTAFALRSRGGRSANPPFDMVEHCHSLGLGVAQTRLPSNDPEAIRKFRDRVESLGMRTILGAPLPREEKDVAVFDGAVKACKEAGAVALHAAMTARRYEQFPTLEAFKTNFEQCKQSVRLAEPVLRKHRIPLAVENHKGWRAGEQAEWIKGAASEWVGICFDFGNNVALCEDPMDTLRALAPYTVFCHMKDMGVAHYEDGFLLSEVSFGEGFVDLKQIVTTLQQKDRNMIFCLEMITRDPLKIPVFTEGYWKTFDDTYSPLPGRDLAKVLDIVRKNPPKTPLPKMTGLPPEAQVKAEDDYNLQCVEWSRRQLSLA